MLLYQTTLVLAGRQLYTPDIIVMSVNSHPLVFERGTERKKEREGEECSLQRNVNWSVIPSYSFLGGDHIYSSLCHG